MLNPTPPGQSILGIEVELTKEECLTGGMSDKEYSIQKALGSLPVKNMSWGSYAGSQFMKGFNKGIKNDESKK